MDKSNLKPYEALLGKLISAGISLHKNLNFPKKYKPKHQALVKEMYKVALSDVAAKYKSCELIQAYQFIAVQVPPLVQNYGTTLYGFKVFLDLDLFNNVFLDKFETHPAACMIPRKELK